MILGATTDLHKWAMYDFLRKHGIELQRSVDFQAIGRISPQTKDLIAVVGYNGFCGQTCLIHVSGDGNWLNRELLWAAFDYPFNQAKMVQIFGCVGATNKKALKLNEHLGFKIFHTIVEGWYPGEDMVVLTMRKKDCPWLDIKAKYEYLKVA